MKEMFVLPLVLIAVVTAALADIPPPNWDVNFPAGFEKARAPLSHGLRMGSLDIKFEETTLASVQQAIGAGQIASQGDAGEAILWLCYTFKTANNGGRIWVVSHAEMGGPDHLVGHVKAMLDDSAVASPDCPLLPEKFQPMSFDHGVWLGMKGIRVAQDLGTGYSIRGKWTLYGYLSEPDAGGCQLSNYLMFETSGGMVRSLGAGQVTSC